jgi:hypothetical protein
MLKQPSQIFMQILEHFQLLNVADVEQRFDFALNESNFNNLQKYENTKGFVEKGKSERFFRVGKAEQWRDVLLPNQIDKLYEDHKDIMEEFGYEKSTINP